MIHPKITLEICAGDIDSVKAAVGGGAQRVELCSALSEGGVTPSAGFIRAARRECVDTKLMVLIRPRGGDFVYSPAEVECMVNDIKICAEMGVDGVVIGALTVDGNVDMDACRQMISAAGEMSVTFHRAFDMTSNPQQALEDVIALGCERILTSGQAQSAIEGASVLRMLQDKSAGRIGIMAGAGVNSRNIEELLRMTAVEEVHASASGMKPSKMKFQRGDVKMGASDFDEFSRKTTCVAEVYALAEIIKNIQL